MDFPNGHFSASSWKNGDQVVIIIICMLVLGKYIQETISSPVHYCFEVYSAVLIKY